MGQGTEHMAVIFGNKCKLAMYSGISMLYSKCSVLVLTGVWPNSAAESPQQSNNKTGIIDWPL